MIDRHHLLECILWPNGDGTFRKIINSAKRLKDLGIYDDYKLTIPIERSLHQNMHREFEKGTEYSFEGKNNPMYGRTGDKHPMYGRTGDKCGKWKGDNVGPQQKKRRAKRDFKNGNITEEELRLAMDEWNKFQNEYRKERRRNKCQH